MERVTYYIHLDARKSGSQTQIRFRQGENISRKIIFTLAGGSDPLDFSREDRVVLRATKPDGTQILDDCIISGTTASYVIGTQLTVVAGRVECDLVVYGADGSILYSPRFDIYVEADQFDGEPVTSTDEFKALDAALRDVQIVWANENDREEAEQERRDAELLREEAEAAREAKLAQASATIKTLEPDAEATVNAEMSEEKGLQFAFGIPRGKDGQPGQPGEPGIKGDKGDAFKYEDFTPEQLDALKGADGYTPQKGVDYFDGKDGEPGYTPVKGKDYFDGQDGNPGADGFSPTVEVTPIEGGNRVTITDKDGKKSFDVMDGENTEGGTPVPGEDGEDGGYYIPEVSAEGDLSWTPTKADMPAVEPVNIIGPPGPTGLPGAPGSPGQDGDDGNTYIPVVTRHMSTDPAVRSYYEIAWKINGGADAGLMPVKLYDGADGSDGNGIKNAALNADYTLTLTFDDGTSYTTPSIRGAAGKDGAAGAPGADGTSVGIESISESTASGGTNLMVFTDGKSLRVLNGKDGAQGAPGQPGADGYSPSITVTDIEGGHRVTITDAEGTRSFDVLDGVGGEGGAAIIDVATLPTEDIREDVFYGVLSTDIYYDGANMHPTHTCQVVETLPEIGEPATDATLETVHAYYALDTGAVSGYLPAELAGAFGLPAGWYPAEMLFEAAGFPYYGIVNDPKEMTAYDAFYILMQRSVNYYANEQWNDLRGVVWRGDAAGAVVLNDMFNVASGRYATAMGDRTTASGYASVAMGINTTAGGDESVAMGFDTTASGSQSVAMGRYNIIDEVNKYAHIVGNGIGNNDRSNAHTLDWDGVAWWPKTPMVGGASMDDPDAVKLLTEAAVPEILAQAKKSGEFDGADGADGRTPVKGTDYWTAQDRAEMKNELAAALVVQEPGTASDKVMSQKAVTDEFEKRGQFNPPFAPSVQWLNQNGDTSKLYLLPDGYIYAWQTGGTQEVYTDVLKDVGYQENKRISSSGTIAAWDTTDVTGYIPVKAGDVIRLKNVYVPDTYNEGGSSYGHMLGGYKADKTFIKQVFLCSVSDGSNVALDRVVEDGRVVQFTVAESIFGADVAYIVIGANDINADSEVYVNSTFVNMDAWASTGVKVVSDTSDKIPEYWEAELADKADAIQQAVEAAGRNKSAFLWYTDAHWPNNSKVSPRLLKYLVANTPINRVNFGGDIVGDPIPHNHENTKYVYEWREMISGLRNHHSVYGNHDVYHRAENVNDIAYAQLLAPEESAEMVVGGESYYYIDSPAEKTRYLYLAYITPGAGFSDQETMDEMVAQGVFIQDALESVKEGWHIVAIAHRWYQYTRDANNQLTIEGGGVPVYEAEILRVFDAYNARATTHASPNYITAKDFTNAKGKVEFCIGGHVHLDYDFATDGGIPVIITASDTNQERNTEETEDSGTVGSTTESAVFGVIADYTDTENTKITVVGIGRGTSRVIGGESAPAEPVNLFDKDDPDVLDTGRFNSSNNAVAYTAGQLVTGYIKAQVGDTFTVQTDKDLNTSAYTCDAMMYKADKSVLDNLNAATTTWELSADGLTGVFTLPAAYPNWAVTFETTAYVRFCVAYNDINNIVITKA